MLRIRPARTVDLPGLAAVLQDAFSEKLRVMFGRKPDKVRELLETVYTGPVKRRYDGLLVAERDGRVVGTLVIEPMYHTEAENRAIESRAVRELGLPRALFASFLLWLMSHEPGPDEAHISDLGVAPDCQGEGIGTLLLRRAEEWAREHGRSRLTLWVAATNGVAVHVYEKTGFTIHETRSSWPLKLAFGVRHWHFMQKSLPKALPETVESAATDDPSLPRDSA
jgi:ribosomal protein S18 acetylase RimI-like enzyme